MTYEEFYKEVQRITDSTPVSINYGRYGWGSRKSEETIYEAEVWVSWETGGARGGNCWGGEAESYTVDEYDYEIPPFEDLDILFAEFFPNLTLNQYQEFSRELIHEGSYSQSEYYGNYTDYNRKYVKLKEFYDLWQRETERK